jgi:hypothetical protein
MNTIYLAINLNENLDGRFPQSKCFGLIIGLKLHAIGLEFDDYG